MFHKEQTAARVLIVDLSRVCRNDINGFVGEKKKRRNEERAGTYDLFFFKRQIVDLQW